MSGFATLTLAGLIILILAAGVSMVLPRRKSAGNANSLRASGAWPNSGRSS